ncbi:MAG: response regulator transcription factor [Eubacteriales bacterium]|nr:response regulator transcription factor [Eubacteriales bacterium]
MECNLREKVCRVGICDKNALEIQKGTNFLNQWLSENRERYPNLKFKIYGFSTGAEVCEYLDHAANTLQILFQDIKMKKDGGIQTAQEIADKGKKVILVFLTDYIQGNVEGEMWGHNFFCVKRSLHEWMPKIIDYLGHFQKQRERKNFEWEWRQTKKSLPIKNILYCERELRVTHIYHKNGQERCGFKLSEMEEFLNQSREVFCRCHNSFLVNLYHVVSIRGNNLYLENEKMIPISRSHKKETLEKYNTWLRDDL